MSGHASVERLSLYLDAALSPAERRRVEDHLDSCTDCRQRLAGLRRVVAGLERLPAVAPPADLALRVRREVELRGRRRHWSDLLDLKLPVPLSGNLVLPMFAVILALGGMIYLFATGVELHQSRPTRIVLPDSGSQPMELTAEVGLAEEARGRPAPAPAARAAGVHQLRLLGGVFQRADGVWVERGLARRAADERLDLRHPEPAELDADPELAALAGLGSPVRLRVGERVVEIAVGVAPRP